jgi:exodeoxyribonuclease-1
VSNPDPEGPTLYWYDLETFGLDPARDRIAQFAGVRTDLDLNVIGAPRVLYCKPAPDYLPDPSACLVTGITPQIAGERGLVEAEFVEAIRREFMRPESCVTGYNNLRFDDEVIRHTFYRNLYDPYEREWRDGNSRWDIIDMVRLVAALRPDGLVWPETESGRPSLRLEDLTAANGIEHVGAHDALSDVLATIALARRIKECQPRLYDFVFGHRDKRSAADLLPLNAADPVVHVSGRYSGAQRHLALVRPLARHPGNPNGVIVYDLSVDPTPLIELGVDAIRQRLFTRAEEGGAEPPRIPLKTVHLNRCPVLAPLSVIRPADASRLNIDLDTVRTNLTRLRDSGGLAEKVSAVFEPLDKPEVSDPELMLYRGGFLSDSDRRLLDHAHRLQPSELAKRTWEFQDRRLPELLFRFRARNFPDTLTAAERERWDVWRLSRLNGDESGWRSLPAYLAAIDALDRDAPMDRSRSAVLAALRGYGSAVSGRNPGDLPYT